MEKHLKYTYTHVCICVCVHLFVCIHTDSLFSTPKTNTTL